MPILGPPTAFSPAEWGAQVDYDSWNDLYTPDDGVVLHHGGGSDYTAAQPPYSTVKEAQLLRSWERYHLSKGWRGLAYGWGVGQSGAVYRIRGWNRYGAHLGDVDGDGIANNDELIPIIWIASGNHHTVSDAADESITKLRRWILESAPSATRFYGHKEVQTNKATACPGPNGMAYVILNRELPEEDNTVEFIIAALKEQDMAFYRALQAKTGSPGGNADYWGKDYAGTKPSDEEWRNAAPELFAASLEAGVLSDAGAHNHDGQYVKNVVVSR